MCSVCVCVVTFIFNNKILPRSSSKTRRSRSSSYYTLPLHPLLKLF